MKMTAPKSSLAGLLVAALSAIGCPQPSASFALTQSKSQPKRTKKVQVSIRNVKRTYSDSASTSFNVGPKSKPTATVYWNGYGFICKKDSGEEFWGYSNDLAFQKRQTARFIIKKKVIITNTKGIVTASAFTSKTVTVKRGVPATF